MDCISQTIDDARSFPSFVRPPTIDFHDLPVRGSGDITIHLSKAIRDARDQMRIVAPTSATVLLLGETGVGKEVFAEAIHNASPRRHQRMIRVHCAALPPTLIEREL